MVPIEGLEVLGGTEEAGRYVVCEAAGRLLIFCTLPDRVPDVLFSILIHWSWEVALGDQVENGWLQILSVVTPSGVDAGLKLCR